MTTSVLYVVKGYPQISQTYVKSELEAVWDDYDIRIVCRKEPNVAYANHFPYDFVPEPDRVRNIIEDVDPDVMHTHYLNQVEVVGALAEDTGVPFTVRAHSFDALALRRRSYLERARMGIRRSGRRQLGKERTIRSAVEYLNGELCLGVLIFPFTRQLLLDAGVREDKLVDCWPVVNHQLFDDRSPNGDAVMNTGAAIAKKHMEDFLHLGELVPEVECNLYALGYRVKRLQETNRAMGSPVMIRRPVEPDEMPKHYKQHRWLVYTASFDLATVGWPMAVAEAQAAGVGVCVPNIRPDMRTYVGADAGILYDSVEELPEIIRGPVPTDMREAGFEQAKRSDIRGHRHLLTDLWDGATATSS